MAWPGRQAKDKESLLNKVYAELFLMEPEEVCELELACLLMTEELFRCKLELISTRLHNSSYVAWCLHRQHGTQSVSPCLLSMWPESRNDEIEN